MKAKDKPSKDDSKTGGTWKSVTCPCCNKVWARTDTNMTSAPCPPCLLKRV